MDGLNFQNLKLFLAVLEDEDLEKKKLEIKKCLDLDADVNAQDANNNNNTSLHFAVLKDEVEIVKLLKNDYKARIDIKNNDGQTPLDLATHLTSDNQKEILNILGAPKNVSNIKPGKVKGSVFKQQNTMKSDLLKLIFESDKNAFPKEKGTSGVSGHLYESKLLSLVYLRLRKKTKNVGSQCDEQMEYFYLGTNRPQIGAFDDLYLKYKYKGRKKADVMFIQAKHKLDAAKGRITRDALHSKDGIYNLTKYFKAYMKIKHLFHSKESSKDTVFSTKLDDVNCKFIIYTVGKPDIKPAEIISGDKTSEKDCDLILTSERENIFQIIPHDNDIEILTRSILDENLKNLGKKLVKHILNGQVDLNLDDILRMNHVVLADKVISVSKQVELETHRTGKLSKTFFSSDDEHISTLREAMYNELVSDKYNGKRSIKDKDVQSQVKKMLSKPSKESISKLLGNVVVFNDKNNTLKFIENVVPEGLQHLVTKLKAVRVTNGDIKDAIEFIGKRKLESKKFKVPLGFGNPDIATGDTNAKKYINLLGSTFIKLLNNYKVTRIVEINSSTFDVPSREKGSKEKRIDERDIASTVGNLLTFDDESQLLKFNTNIKTLPKYANMLLKYIQDNIAKSVDLNSYRLRIYGKNIPRATWRTTDTDKIDANEFIGKLWFYAAQAQEERVENIVKEEIDNLNKASWQTVDKKLTALKVQSEAIYLKFHDVIQKWWMLPKSSYYITNKTDIYDTVRECVTISPLLSILNFICVVNFENANIRFNDDAISKFQLDTLTANDSLTIISKCSMLTAKKLKQLYENQDHLFINLNTVSVLINDIDMVIHELKHSDADILIIVVENLTNASMLRDLCRLLKIKLKENKGKHIIITNTNVATELKKDLDRIELDDNVTLDDIDDASQETILEKVITFQGYEVKLKELLNNSPKQILNNGILYKIVTDENIEIGNSKLYLKHDAIFHYPYYLDRSLQLGRRVIPVNTFHSVKSNEVAIVAPAGMGKSTLLSSLFTVSKSKNSSFCAIRMCLPYYSTALSKWDSANADVTDVLALLFKIALKEELTNNKELNDIDFTLVEDNGKIALDSFDRGTDCHLFGLQIYIDFFNKGKLTFVFDGFDEICPTYMKEVIQLLEILKSHPTKQCIWVTSRPHNEAQRSLKETFGSLYTLTPLSPEEQRLYLLEYFNVHLNAAKFNQKHISNINTFMEYMSQFSKTKKGDTFTVKFRCVYLHIIYSIAVEYFFNIIDNITLDIDKDSLKIKWNLGKLTFPPLSATELIKKEAYELTGNPLNLNIIAHYLETQIKGDDSRNSDPVWDLMMNTFALYEHFITTKIGKICHEEKDEHVLTKTSERIRYESEIKEFKEKHKKIALFTFYNREMVRVLLSREEMEETDMIIDDIEKCKEKRGFVDEVVNGVPKFVHLIFAEYFAVEYICWKLKAELSSDISNGLLMTLSFLMNVFLFEGFPGLRNVFDYKLGIDNELRQLLCNNYCKNIIFGLLLEQFLRQVNADSLMIDTVLSIAHDERLVNIVLYLMSCVETCLNNDNLHVFIKLIRHSAFINTAVSVRWYEPVHVIFDSLRRVNNDTFQHILCTGYLLNEKIDKSIVDDNTLIINCIYSGLQKAVDNLIGEFGRRNVMKESTEEFPDVVVVTRHYSPTRGGRTIGVSLRKEMMKEFEK